jgi:hypothetical protein
MKTFSTIAAAALLLLGSVTSARAGSCPENLPNGLGYWKTHPDLWPVEFIKVGNRLLGKEYIIQTVAEMRASSDGDGVIILLHQIIPAKINIEGGVDPSPVADAVAQADSLLALFWIGDVVDDASRDLMIELAAILDEFNSGDFCTLPVELVSFTGRTDHDLILLSWSTASEAGNAGFEVEHRQGDSGAFESLTFVTGYGTTNVATQYSVQLDDLGYGRHQFRLKQVDFDGTFSYSATIEVNSALTSTFALTEAYPNPFNPSTNIRFSLREASLVTLGVYDMTGRLIRTLANGSFDAGSHNVTFRADNLPSGTYLYRLQTAAGSVTGSIVLLK